MASVPVFTSAAGPCRLHLFQGFHWTPVIRSVLKRRHLVSSPVNNVVGRWPRTLEFSEPFCLKAGWHAGCYESQFKSQRVRASLPPCPPPSIAARGIFRPDPLAPLRIPVRIPSEPCSSAVYEIEDPGNLRWVV